MPSFSTTLVYVWKRKISESLIPTGGSGVKDLLCYHHIVVISRSTFTEPLICTLGYVKHKLRKGSCNDRLEKVVCSPWMLLSQRVTKEPTLQTELPLQIPLNIPAVAA